MADHEDASENRLLTRSLADQPDPGVQPIPLDPRRPRLTTVKVRARDEDFRIVQVHGNLFICSRANGNCCCGWEEKGRMPFDNSLWSDEWERRRIRNRLHLTFTGCLGPCAVGNNALLQIHGRSLWLKDLNNTAFIPQVFDYAESMLHADRVLPPPEGLRDRVYERYLTSGATDDAVHGEVADSEGLERLDPVCLMDVDPATARYKVEYEGRTIVFCAPSCKKLFLADPAAYVGG